MASPIRPINGALLHAFVLHKTHRKDREQYNHIHVRFVIGKDEAVMMGDLFTRRANNLQIENLEHNASQAQCDPRTKRHAANAAAENW